MVALARLPPRLTTPRKCLSFATCRMLNHFTTFSQTPVRRTITTLRDFYINGRWIPPVAARDFHVRRSVQSFSNSNLFPLSTLQVIDPSTEAPCAVISLGSDADADAAVAAASAALPSWSSTAPKARGAYIAAILSQYSLRSLQSTLSIQLQIFDTFAQS